MWEEQKIRKIFRVGDSLAITLPPILCHELGLKRGDYLDLAVVDEVTMIARRLKVVASDKLEKRIDDTLPKIDYGK